MSSNASSCMLCHLLFIICMSFINSSLSVTDHVGFPCVSWWWWHYHHIADVRNVRSITKQDAIIQWKFICWWGQKKKWQNPAPCTIASIVKVILVFFNSKHDDALITLCGFDHVFFELLHQQLLILVLIPLLPVEK